MLSRVKLIRHPWILFVHEEFTKDVSSLAGIALTLSLCTSSLSIKLLDVLPESTNAKISLLFNKSASLPFEILLLGIVANVGKFNCIAADDPFVLVLELHTQA